MHWQKQIPPLRYGMTSKKAEADSSAALRNDKQKGQAQVRRSFDCIWRVNAHQTPLRMTSYRPDLGGQVFEELAGAAKPRTLEAALVAGQGRAFVEDLPGPLAGLGGAAFGGEQIGEVQIGLRRG